MTLRLVPYTLYLLFTGMPESTGVASGFVELFYDFKSGKIYFLDDHLGNAVCAMKRIRFGAQIDDRDFYFTPVIGIDGSG